MTEEPYQSATKGVKSPIAAERVADWLVSNKVLSIALGGTDRKMIVVVKTLSLCVNILIPKLHGNETGSIGISPTPPLSYRGSSITQTYKFLTSKLPLFVHTHTHTHTHTHPPGNLHQSQYCNKIQSIVEFLGTKLSLDDLSSIWEMQVLNSHSK